MRAFNGDTIPIFVWAPEGGSPITDGVSSQKLQSEVFYSELSIDSVKLEDYNNYTVTVNNKVKGNAEYLLTLEEQGKLS